MGLVTIVQGCGKTIEFDTVACCHCQAVVAVLHGVGVKLYRHHRQCPRCRAPICRACSEAMDRLGTCPGPIAARVEHALKTGRWDESYAYDYRSPSRPASAPCPPPPIPLE